ncbi:MAG: cyanophycinase [Proteobacteria bacterium]|nr:MAG: cyanophycinase [Pseudomonadota bacterium]
MDVAEVEHAGVGHTGGGPGDATVGGAEEGAAGAACPDDSVVRRGQSAQRSGRPAMLKHPGERHQEEHRHFHSIDVRYSIFTMSRLLCALLLAAAATAQIFPDFLTGNAADVQTKSTPGFALVGGGKDQDAVMRWFLERAGGGDVVVLRASGADGYNMYLYDLAHVDSIETLVINTEVSAADPAAVDRIRHAEALFIAGGDQWNYIRLWRGAPVGKAIQELIDKGIPVGGTSAGLAVLGEYAYTAEHDTITSRQALADPFDEHLTLAHDFLRIPALRGVVTDSHFHSRDRMGRTLAFLARMLEEPDRHEARAIAVDERSAALMEPDGKLAVEGEGSVYLIRARKRAEICRPGVPLTFRGISVYRVAKGGGFDLKSWRGRGGASYVLNVEAGTVRSTQEGGNVY